MDTTEQIIGKAAAHTVALSSEANPKTSLPEEPPSGLDRPLRVLFIHPVYPNQFTALGAEVGKSPGFECFGLTHQGFGPMVSAAESGMPHFGFLPDGATTMNTYPHLTTFEYGMRNARGIANVLMAMGREYRFDAVVGHASFGATLYLKAILDAAVISYVELPGNQLAAARLEFPYTLDNVFSSCAFEALVYASVLNSDLGVVPSKHTKDLFPPGLRPKIRVQSEGFAIENLPSGGPAERQALGLPVEARLVGFFGRTLEAVRGFDIFVQVAKRLYAQDKTLRFVVLGDDQTIYGNEMRYISEPTFKEHVFSRAELPEGVLIWRRRLPFADFRRCITCLDLAIFPLFEAATNWSLFEAMVVGLPILSSNRAFVPEVIRNGREGILLNPYDIQGFVDQASNLLRDSEKARALGKAAQARIRQRYTLARVAKGYRRIILEAIKRYKVRRGQSSALNATP